MNMVSEIDAIIDDLLERWHEWKSGYRLSKGFSSSDATCKDFTTPTHWDWKNGAMEGRSDEIQMKGVDRAIERIPNHPQPWNTALQFEARNLASSFAVWSSPRLPKDHDELNTLRMEARTMLIRELYRDGIIGG